MSAREDRPGDRRLVAYVVAAPGRAPSVNELRSFLQQKLPEYMVPSAFMYLLESLPLTPNGKLDRKALPAPEQGRAEDREEGTLVYPSYSYRRNYWPGIWADVLKLDKVGIHDNFFDLGGHSLLATQVFPDEGQPTSPRFPCVFCLRVPPWRVPGGANRTIAVAKNRPNCPIPSHVSASTPRARVDFRFRLRSSGCGFWTSMSRTVLSTTYRAHCVSKERWTSRPWRRVSTRSCGGTRHCGRRSRWLRGEPVQLIAPALMISLPSKISVDLPRERA